MWSMAFSGFWLLFFISVFSGAFLSMTSTIFLWNNPYFWEITLVRSNFSPKFSSRKSLVNFSGVKCWRSLLRDLTLESSYVLRFSIIKNVGNWSLIFSIIFSLLQCILLKVTKILSPKQDLFCSANLVAPRICGVNQLLVSTSRNSFTSLLLSMFSRLTFKSPANVTFLFPLKSVLRICFKYRKNSVSVCFGCLYTTPTTRLSLRVYYFNPLCLIFTFGTRVSLGEFLPYSKWYVAFNIKFTNFF